MAGDNLSGKRLSRFSALSFSFLSLSNFLQELGAAVVNSQIFIHHANQEPCVCLCASCEVSSPIDLTRIRSWSSRSRAALVVR